MEKIEIKGNNYFGNYNRTRLACRAIVIEDNKILTSYETKNDQYMLPGGGLEANESYKECCIREIQEETGFVVETSEPVLEIDEFYEDVRYISYYFVCNIVGSAKRNLTLREKEVGMEPKWVDKDELLNIFSKHEMYAATDEMRRGAYLREYSALNNIL